MNISFTDKQKSYILEQVGSGDFQNASEVVRDALRIHAIMRNKFIKELKEEIEIGWQSPDSKKSIKDILVSKKKDAK